MRWTGNTSTNEGIEIDLVILIHSYLHSNEPSRVLTWKVIKFDEATRG
jgi:hypothetical protein